MSKQSTDTIQILKAHEQGLSIEDIALALSKDPAAVALVIKTQVDNNRKMTLYERFGDLKKVAIETLKEIAEIGENESARVNAAKILLDEADGNNGHGGFGMKIDYTQIAERLVKVEGAVQPVRNLIKMTPQDNKVEVLKASSKPAKIVQLPKEEHNSKLEAEEIGNGYGKRVV